MDRNSGEVKRRGDNHHPTVWGDHFFAYAHLSRANEWEKKQHEHLKEEVRKMLVMAPPKSLQNLNLINAIQCLGHEIEESLACIYSCYEELNGEADKTDTVMIVAARKYISFYQEDKSCDEVLLNFAKLDFNILQEMHKRELCDITRWWKELDLAKTLPFARDIIVELYLWSLGICRFEPHYWVARNILTKMLCFVSVTDDIYDPKEFREMAKMKSRVQ